MSTTEGIPQDVWDEARRTAVSVGAGLAIGATESIAVAIMSAEKRGEEREREACELVAQDWTGGAEYIAAAIRKRGA